MSFRLGLGSGFGLGGGGGVLVALQYLFNGFPSSITGGGQTVADKDGVLRTVDSGVPAITGGTFISASEGFSAANFTGENVRTANGTVKDYSGDANWLGYLGEGARTNSLPQSTPDNTTAYWSKSPGMTFVEASPYMPGSTPYRVDSDGTNQFEFRGDFLGTFDGGTDTLSAIIENVDAAVTEITIFDNTASAHVGHLQLDWSTGALSIVGSQAGATVNYGGEKLLDVGPNGGEVYRIWVSADGQNVGNQRLFAIYPRGRAAAVAESTIPHHMQLEEGVSFPSTPISTEGTTVTRPATVLSETSAGRIRANGQIYDLAITPTAVQDGSYLWGSYVDANNGLFLLSAGGVFVWRKRVAGTDYDATSTISYTADKLYRVQRYVSADGSTGIRVQNVTDAGAFEAFQANADTTDAVLGTTFEIGSDGNGANQFFANYSRDITDYEDGDCEAALATFATEYPL